MILPASAYPGWPSDVTLPAEPGWKNDYAGSDTVGIERARSTISLTHLKSVARCVAKNNF